jgi:hypothetical protein
MIISSWRSSSNFLRVPRRGETELIGIGAQQRQFVSHIFTVEL